MSTDDLPYLRRCTNPECSVKVESAEQASGDCWGCSEPFTVDREYLALTAHSSSEHYRPARVFVVRLTVEFLRALVGLSFRFQRAQTLDGTGPAPCEMAAFYCPSDSGWVENEDADVDSDDVVAGAPTIRTEMDKVSVHGVPGQVPSVHFSAYPKNYDGDLLLTTDPLTAYEIDRLYRGLVPGDAPWACPTP